MFHLLKNANITKVFLMGLLVVIEGISGSGKSSFIQDFCNCLSRYDIPNVSYGGFNISEQSTDLTKFCHSLVKHKRFIEFPLISETHLLLSEMMMDIELNVRRELSENKVVVYENYFDSLFIYQSCRIQMMNALDIDKEKYLQYLSHTIDLIKKLIHIPKPDVTVLLNTAPTICNQRIVLRDNLAVTDEHVALQLAIRSKYFEYYQGNDDIITYDSDFMKKDAILNQLVSIVRRRIL